MLEAVDAAIGVWGAGRVVLHLATRDMGKQHNFFSSGIKNI